MGFCDCDDLTLQKVVAPGCPTEADFKNIIKVAFQKRQATPSFDGTINIITERTEWDVLVAAADDTLVMVSPFLTSSTLVAGEQVTEGGNDNTTILGIPEELRKGHGQYTGDVKALSPDNQVILDRAKCLSVPNSVTKTELQAFFLTSDNKILSKRDFTGVNAYSFFIGDISKEGDSRNKNMMSFFLEPNWSEDLVINQAEFDVSTLINA